MTKRTRKKTTPKAETPTVEPTPAATPPPAPGLFSTGPPADPNNPPPPSQKALDDEIEKQRRKGGRPRKATQEQLAHEEQLLRMLDTLSAAAVGALNGGFDRLDQSFKPLFDRMELKDGGKRESFKLADSEQLLLAATAQMGMAKVSPEFLAKYGFLCMLTACTLSIGFPRFMLYLRLETEMKEIKAKRATVQENAQRTSGSTSDSSGVHGQRENDPSEIIGQAVVGE